MKIRLFLVLTLCTLFALASPVDARCAVISLADDAQQSAFIVEASLVQSGESAVFRTTREWKTGRAAPTTFRLQSRRGRAHWPWADADNVGHTYLLFLRPDNSSGVSIRRCGASAEATDALRQRLRDLGYPREGR